MHHYHIILIRGALCPPTLPTSPTPFTGRCKLQIPAQPLYPHLKHLVAGQQYRGGFRRTEVTQPGNTAKAHPKPSHFGTGKVHVRPKTFFFYQMSRMISSSFVMILAQRHEGAKLTVSPGFSISAYYQSGRNCWLLSAWTHTSGMFLATQLVFRVFWGRESSN